MSTPILDVTRLYRRVSKHAPTGVDRLEYAWLCHLLDESGEASFMLSDGGRFVRFGRDRARTLREEIQQRWIDDAAVPVRRRGSRAPGWRGALDTSWRRVFTRSMRSRNTVDAPLILSGGHHELHRGDAWRGLKTRLGASLVVYIHDLIPLSHPEYVVPREVNRHHARLATTAELADLVFVNSHDTRERLEHYLAAHAPRTPPISVLPLGIGEQYERTQMSDDAGRPYFVTVGTIEPRKNHLLLLQVWQRLCETLGEAAPDLYLVGRKGWESEHVFRLLKRSAALRKHVKIVSGVADARLTRMLAGCRALLLPSFVEGFGLPAVEGLAAGVPLLCSDIPVLREVGGGVPEYIDPLDGPGWQSMIADYTQHDSPRRAAQIARLDDWRPFTWKAHLSRFDAELTGAFGRKNRGIQ